MPKVSIIMPVYNSEKYVYEAAQSILKQSEQDIELIMVDDGSKDTSGQICDRIACEDKRVVVIHQQNGGICNARNAAIAVASGEYLTFCDNDDKFLPGLIEDNYSLAKKYDADVVRFSRRRVETREGKVVYDSVMNNFEFSVITREEYPKYEYDISKTGNGVWVALYRSSFIKENNILFDSFIRFGHEDTMFNILVYQHFNRIVLNPKTYYLWENRMEHSTTGKFNINYLDSMKKCLAEEKVLAEIFKTDQNTDGVLQSRLTRTYLYSIYDYLILAKDKLSRSEKKAQIIKFRDSICWLKKTSYTTLKKDGWFFVFLWFSFYHDLYMLPYYLMSIKQKIFN